MALIRSSLLSTINGSIGGTVYSNNRGGAYARNRSRPNNPRSSNQVRARASFGTWSSRWTTVLTPAQRTLWNNYAALAPAFNRIGQSIVLTGQQAYVRANTLLALANLTAVLVPPALPQPALITSAQVVNYIVATDRVTLLTDTAVTGTVLAFCGPLQSAGSLTTKVPYRFYGVFASAAATILVVQGSNLNRRTFAVGNEMTWRFLYVTSTGGISNFSVFRGIGI